MNSRMMIAPLLAILMVVAVVPMIGSEDADALTGDSNISLNVKFVNLYTDSSTQNSFNFTVDMSNCTSSATSVVWSVNSIGTPQATVSLSNVTGTSVTVTAVSTGSIEIVAYADSQNYASAVVGVQTGYAPATEFSFYIQWGYDSENSSVYDYVDDLSDNLNGTIFDGVWIHVDLDETDIDSSDFNALTALMWYCEQCEWDIDADSGSGWLNSFLGMGMYPDSETGTWYYWAQYHAVGATGEWEFNNYCLGYLDSQEYSYIGLIFWGSPITMDCPDFPGYPLEDDYVDFSTE